MRNKGESRRGTYEEMRKGNCDGRTKKAANGFTCSQKIDSTRVFPRFTPGLCTQILSTVNDRTPETIPEDLTSCSDIEVYGTFSTYAILEKNQAFGLLIALTILNGVRDDTCSFHSGSSETSYHWKLVEAEIVKLDTSREQLAGQ